MLDKIIQLNYSKAEAKKLIDVSKNIEKDYELLLEKYPIQYLIGNVDFYGYKIYVNRNVLIPRFETEQLVEKTIKKITEKYNKKIDILDLCTGSGCIAVALKKNMNCNMYASDISKKALLIAKKNKKINNVKINYIESDLFSNIKQKFDVIISNPPYIDKEKDIVQESVKKYEPSLALYASNDGLYFYEKIIKNISKYLKEKYLVCLEIGENQHQQIIKIIKDNIYNCNISIEKDYSGKERFVFIENKK